MRLAWGDVQRARELSNELLTLRLGEASALPGVLRELKTLLGASQSLAYAAAPAEAGLRLDLFHGDGFSFDLAAQLNRWLATAPTRFGHYDALRPERAQRNVALTTADLWKRSGKRPPVLSFMERVGISSNQLRALICDGPSLMAWVGGFREEPFGARERTLLGRLVPALQQRLVLERQLSTSALQASALVAALEEIPAAAFIVDRGPHVCHANAAGRALLDADRACTLAALRASDEDRAATFRMTRLCSPGLSGHQLAVQRRRPPDTEARLRAAGARFALTARQLAVLARLILGEANKTIAANLGCAEHTVALHVTAILEKSGSESRAELIARFFAERD